MGAAAATPHRTPRKDFSTPRLPGPGPRSAIPVSPTRYTSRRNLPRKTDRRLERLRETGNLLTLHSPILRLQPVAQTSTHPPAERRHDKHAAPLLALPALPTPPISSHSLQTCPGSRTKTAPHSRSCSQSSSSFECGPRSRSHRLP